MKVFRANLDDVERLSYGRGAKKQRGTGNRNICHRLNKNERTLYELAKQAGYLTLKGTGYRKERKGSPLWNIFRQRCDALQELCVVVEKHPTEDKLWIDFSTLRVKNDSTYVSSILQNVFRKKYPELYSTLDISETTKVAMNGVENETFPTVVLFLNSLTTPINWTQMEKPIWAVQERYLMVSCARDVAKMLAKDVLKESHTFDLFAVDSWTTSKEKKAKDCHEIQEQAIDWNDI